MIAASILVGAVIGALTCSRLAERRGRHGTLLLIGIVFVVGSVAASLSQIEDHLANGRFKPADLASR